MKQREYFPIPKYRQFKPYSIYKNKPRYAKSPLLRYIVAWIIWLSTYSTLFSARTKLKVGDKVKYNWMAYVQIYSDDKDFKAIKTISHILYRDESGIEFEEGSGCDLFWVRKIYFWEKEHDKSK